MKLTLKDFAKRAGTSLEVIQDAVRNNYLVTDASGNEPLVVVNLFANMFCKAVREGADLNNLPRWKGVRGKQVRKLHGIGIYQNKHGNISVIRPDKVVVPFRTLEDAERYCLTTTEFIKHNSRTRATQRRAKPVYLAQHELEYLLTILPNSNNNSLLRKKLSRAATQ